MNVFVLVAFVAMLLFAVGAGLIVIDRYFEKKRDKRIGKIVCNDVIPTAEQMLENYTNELLNDCKKMMTDAMSMFKDET